MHLRFLSALFLSASLAVASAQEKPVAAAVEIRMLAFGPEQQRTEAYAQDPLAKEGAASVAAPIKTYLNHQFATIQLSSRKLAFTTKPDRASLTRDGETIATVTLPEKVNSAILVFLPGKDKGTSRIMAIDDSKGAFPAGSFHVSNLSAVPVRLMLEQKTYELPGGSVTVIQDPPVREGQMSGMRAFAQQGGNWNPVATGLWPHPGRSRGVKIIYQDPATGQIQLSAFDDVPPREAAKPSAASR